MGKANRIARVGWAESLVAVGVLGALAQTSSASPIPVENFSFETPSLNNGHYNAGEVWLGGNPAGWVWTGGNGDAGGTCNPSDGQVPGTSGNGTLNTDGLLPGTADGYQYTGKGVADGGASGVPQKAYLTYTPDAGWELGTFEAGATYTLTVAVNSQGRYYWTHNSYSATLLANGAAVGTPAECTVETFNTFQDLTYTYVATEADEGKAIGIKFMGAGVWGQVAFDNIRLNVEVPEPASLSLLAVASLGLLGRQRRACRA